MTGDTKLVSVQPHLGPGERWVPAVGPATQRLLKDRSLSPTEKATLRNEALEVLARCVPPEGDPSRTTGLVVGYVQSGKTMSFTAVSALARDNRFRFVIIITGLSKNLFSQSNQRLKKDLGPFSYPSRWRHITSDEVRENPSVTRQEVVRALAGWEDEDAEEYEREAVLLTVMKNGAHLDKVTALLRDVLKGHPDVPALIIDDEADQASMNTRVRKGNESATYSRLLRLRALFPKHTFLQYTATPQAPLLINIIDALSPGFVEVLTPGASYTGSDVFFKKGGRQELELVRDIPVSDVPSDDHPLYEPPPSYLEAMRVFYVGVAIGLVNGFDGDEPRNRSMMVHPSQLRTAHHQYLHWATMARQGWLAALQAPGSDPDKAEVAEEFRTAYDLLAGSPFRPGDLPPFERVSARLKKAIDKTLIHEINTRSGPKTPDVKWETDYSHILVGGEALGRGYTVEGLTVSYMPRPLGVGHADTIQQRARWFGYKADYLGYCRVYLTEDVKGAYERYLDHEEHVRMQLKAFKATGRPFREWKRAFFLDASLKPTRHNVLDLDYVQFRFENKWVHPDAPHASEHDLKENRALVARFRKSVEFVEGAGVERSHMVARNLRLSDVYRQLLLGLLHSDPQDSMESTALLVLIKSYLEQHADPGCDVYDMRGGGLQKGAV